MVELSALLASLHHSPRPWQSLVRLAQTIKNDIFSKPDSVGKKIGSVCVGGDERHKAA
jgi:hypothetical protein